MGRLIPAGTGFEYYRNVRIPAVMLSITALFLSRYL